MQTKHNADQAIQGSICSSTHLIGAVELTADEQTQLATFIDRRFFEAFRKSPFWPRYMVYGEPCDIIALTISGLGAGSSSDESGDFNGNYILLGQDGGGNGAVAGTNVYYNPAVGTKSSTQVSNSTLYTKEQARIGGKLKMLVLSL